MATIKNGRRRTIRVAAEHQVGGEPHRLLRNAVDAASLRFRETHLPEPLFVDAYAGCFLSSPTELAGTNAVSSSRYCLATKFIDDKLMSIVNGVDGPRQIVLLTDGMDTRPYRLRWPRSSLIFDVSPAGVYELARQRLEGVGAKIAKTCMLLHVPYESSDLQECLRMKGLSGSIPSVWAIQGLPVMNLAMLEELLVMVSSMAMKGCTFFGELSVQLWEPGSENYKSDTQKWVDKLFMSHGFHVDIVAYDEIARNLNRGSPGGDHGSILFVAQQLRLSDDQMERWRLEFQRIEEAADEDGFEEM
ncbi:hypothetical protein QJS10_CPB17g01278 [Acorus calamus]|uniref:S-adenosyl-L-methionine-dependent methyltransferase n=1 Tax=Acorus calamus TaxID=4465 RepID=A0AAV9CSZ7_ACOCL|nr:hypothetical protein QJS10_CPB17g01278 [Acorus calamus]